MRNSGDRRARRSRRDRTARHRWVRARRRILDRRWNRARRWMRDRCWTWAWASRRHLRPLLPHPEKLRSSKQGRRSLAPEEPPPHRPRALRRRGLQGRGLRGAIRPRPVHLPEDTEPPPLRESTAAPVRRKEACECCFSCAIHPSEFNLFPSTIIAPTVKNCNKLTKWKTSAEFRTQKCRKPIWPAAEGSMNQTNTSCTSSM